MAAHRYWRLYMTAGPAGAGVFAMNELQLMIAAGGVSVATGGAASASTTYSGFSAAAAFDGNLTVDGWASTTQVNEWLKYDFGVGVTKDIVEFGITARGGYGNQAPTGGKLQWSDDDVTWTDSIVWTSSDFVNGETKFLPVIALPATRFANSYLERKANNVTISNSTRSRAISTGAGSVGSVRAHTGKSYAEFVITTLTGTPAVGLMAAVYDPNNNAVLGAEAFTLGYRSGGTVVRNNATVATLAAYVAGDRIDMAVDPFNSLVWFRVNGGNWNNNVLNDPATGVGGIDFSGIGVGRIVPAVGFSATGARIDARFAAADFLGAAPAGYATYDTQQMVIADGGKTYEVPPEVAHTVDGQAKSPFFGGRTQRAFSPAGPITAISGTIKEEGVAVVGRKVQVYDRDSGELLGEMLSGVAGVYSIPAMGRSKVRVVASDPTNYNSLAADYVTPA